MQALSIQKLNKTYQKGNVLNEVSFSVKKGEIVSVMGASGAGKSTLLQCIAGIESCTAVQLELDQQDISNWSAKKRPIVLMFQDSLLFPHMTVLENVTYGLRVRRYNKQEREREGLYYLKKVDMVEHANRYPHQCSGGEQQRIALARALITKPSLLLLDEPFARLDESLRRMMRTWVKGVLKEEGVTALFVTHDREEAMLMGDRIFVMARGTVLSSGKPAELTESPENLEVANLIGEGIVLENRTFISAANLSVVLHKAQLPESAYYIQEGTVTHCFRRHGQVFLGLQLFTDKQDVILPAAGELKVGANVWVWAEESALQPLNGGCSSFSDDPKPAFVGENEI